MYIQFDPKPQTQRFGKGACVQHSTEAETEKFRYDFSELGHFVSFTSYVGIVEYSTVSRCSPYPRAGRVWYGMVWYGMAWHGMAWHGNARHGIANHRTLWYSIVRIVGQGIA